MRNLFKKLTGNSKNATVEESVTGLIREKQEEGRRRAFRVDPKGMCVRINGLTGRCFKVKDLSVMGIGIHHLDIAFQEGMIICMDMLDGDKVIIKGLKARVARCGDNIAGFEFTSVDQTTDRMLNSIVLREQKKMIRIRKDKPRHQIAL